jgi:tetratricopeptide (TPR) repeat protein
MAETRDAIIASHKSDSAATFVLQAAKWLENHPDDLEITYLYAEMLGRMNRYEEAICVFEKALDTFKDSGSRWILFNQIGNLWKYRGQFAKAEHWYRKAIEADPDELVPYISAGEVQERQGKIIEAEDTYRAATQSKQSGLTDWAYVRLGLVLRGQGRLTEASDCFRKALEIDPLYEWASAALADVTEALAMTDRA